MGPNLLSLTEQQALQILENNTIVKNCHFETPLLWKTESPKLPNNQTLAKKQFQSSENKFEKIAELQNPIKNKLMNTLIYVML